ncbi:MAG: hypothetical protein P4L33_20420 [Capsulimonadaceae bacterium]|nr:hypothetical protein [Capsulimonadaceae bacterium]
MIRLSITEPFEGEFRFDTAHEVVDLFEAFSAQGMRIGRSVQPKGDVVRPAADSPEEIARRNAIRARFSPEPGTSYVARAERALRNLGRSASVKVILSQIKLDDPTFVPTGKTPETTLRQVLSRSKTGVFAKDGDGLWILQEFLANKPEEH